MYRSVRLVRIAISLIALAVPTWALLVGYDSLFARMQIFPSLLAGTAVYLIFWVIVTLLYGRIYCSTVCPMGTLIDCISAGRRLALRKKSDYRYCSPSVRTRLVFLIVAFAAVLSEIAVLPTILDPYSAYARMVNEFIARPLGIVSDGSRFTISAFALATLTAVSVAIFSWRRGRLICNTACPIGTLLGYGARRAYFHIEIDPDRCINCGECERVCKAQCIKLPEKIVDNSRCVVCFNCTTVCPNSAIAYKSGRYRLGLPLMQSVEGHSQNTQTTNRHGIEQNIKTHNK